MGARSLALRGRLALFAVVAGALLALPGGALAQSGGCVNETVREEQNVAYLPDCRAYEMVSPLDKNGSDITGNHAVTEASLDGDRAAYMGEAGFAGTTGSGAGGFTQYMAVRGSTGWRSRGITPTPGKEALQFFGGSTAVTLLSDDMTHSVVNGYDLVGGTENIPNAENYYVENNETGALQTVTKDLGSESLFFLTASLLRYAASDDLGVLAFQLHANLLPGMTEPQSKIYLWDHNQLSVAGLLPNGSVPSGGAILAREGGSFARGNQGTMSRDGSRFAFVSPEEGSGKQLYLYRAGAPSAWVSQSEASTPNPEPQKVTFEAMTPDGHQVLFATTDKLLDSDPGGAEFGLYMYTDGPDPEHESNLSFIARVNGEEENLVSGMSEDGKRIYFFTKEAPGFEKTGTYLWDEGTTRFVAPTLKPLGRPGDENRPSEVSADGHRMAFLVKEQLEGSVGVETSLARMYVYDEQPEALTCVSCSAGGTVGSNAEVEPQATKTTVSIETGFNTRFLSSDGRRVFFSTADALVPDDTNGLYDVYEYDVETGAVSLLSSGTGDHGAWLAAASASGDDAFFVTRDSLVGWDTDTLVDLYDVRAGGGFTEPRPDTGGCVGDECQGVPSAVPTFNVASGFNGLGNVVASPGKATAKHKPSSRARQLARALKACRRKPAAKRHRCQARARKKYRQQKANKSTAASRSGR